jgi:ATPase subunit of ABC transporter with duplicated ATPase domains
MDVFPTTTVGGQVVSLGLAAQLLRRPDALLLDESTNNLDLDSVAQLESALAGYRGGERRGEGRGKKGQCCPPL